MHQITVASAVVGWIGVMMMRIKYDKATKAWFNSHICQQTTVCKCEKCGLFYKPSLGHKCKAKEKDEE